LNSRVNFLRGAYSIEHLLSQYCSDWGVHQTWVPSFRPEAAARASSG